MVSATDASMPATPRQSRLRIHNSTFSPPRPEQYLSDRMSHLLLKAASAGDVGKVTRLLDRGVDVNYHSKDKQATGRTALIEAAIEGHLDVVRLLVERGALLNWQDRAVGFTALGWAA